MLDTTLDISSLEDLDFDLTCESNYHDIYGYGEVVAVVYMIVRCCDLHYDKHMCRGCIDSLLQMEYALIHGNSIKGEVPCGQIAEKQCKDCVERIVYLP